MEVGLNPFVSNGFSSQSGPNASDLGRFEFLQLLVAQMSNQDPLDPVDNAEFVSQIAQFSSLDELIKIRQLNELSLSILAEQIQRQASVPTSEEESPPEKQASSSGMLR